MSNCIKCHKTIPHMISMCINCYNKLSARQLQYDRLVKLSAAIVARNHEDRDKIQKLRDEAQEWLGLPGAIDRPKHVHEVKAYDKVLKILGGKDDEQR